MKGIRVKTCCKASSMTGRFVLIVAILAGGAMFGCNPDVALETAEQKYVRNDSTGGDCTQIGIWNAENLTCTLTADYTYRIIIDSDGIILDGNGHSLTGAGTNENNDAITVTRHNGITIKNFVLQNFSYGIHLDDAHGNIVANNVSVSNEGAGISLRNATNNTLTGNRISNNNSDTGICIGYSSSNNIISSNSTTDADRGIYLHDFSNGNTITGNTLSRNLNALTLYDSDSNNTITDNILTENTMAIFLHGNSNNNILNSNTISNNGIGLYLSDGASYNQVYKNKFLNNSNFQVSVSGGVDNLFHLPYSTVGNYWSDYDTPAESCNDLHSDGICDDPYLFNGGQDNLPATS